MDNVRVLPLLVFAGFCLLLLKGMGLMLSGGYVLSGTAPAKAQSAKAQNAQAEAVQKPPASEQAPAPQATDAKPQKKNDAAKKAEAAKASDTAPPEMTMAMAGPGQEGATKAELAILEGLSNRRKTLDQREREISLRENLLKAAEKRVVARIDELKSIESRIEGQLKKRDTRRNAEYQRLVKMYSGMKPKSAARIFDRLDMTVLSGLASQIKPRVMSAILAVMTPSAAERLTLEIAARGKPLPQAAESLPKINSTNAK